jgi:hypothetical protein
MNNNYNIEGTSHILNKRFANGSLTYPTFQEDLIKFKNLIIELEKDKKGSSFVHFGDGDYFFLKKEAVGSATPGRRALSIPYDKFDITPFREGWLKADYHCVEYLEPGNKDKLLELYPGQKTIATEFLYGLTMNRWFFTQFKGKIGLIGACEKLDIIKELMKYPEYQNYLGLEQFNDYINIPQKFACDNIDNTVNMVKTQLENSNPETFIFLYGVGHVKSGLIHHLPKIKNAIYLDIGAGIDALAGLIDPGRPYASNWINYQMKEYNYGKIDLLQYSSSNDKNRKVV